MLTVIIVCIEQEGGRQDMQPSRLTKHFRATGLNSVFRDHDL